jgi:hypothetical protein
VDPLTLVLGVAVPALVAGAVLLVRRRWLGGVALALAYLAGTLVIFRDDLGREKPPRLAVVGLLAAAIAAIADPRRRRALFVLPAALGPALALYAVARETLPLGAKIGHGVLEAAISYAGILTFDIWASRREHFAQGILAWFLAAAGAVAVAIPSWVGGGQAAGTVAAGLGALVVLSLWKPVEGRIHSALPVALALLPGVWALAYHLSGFPLSATLLLALAPLGLWIGEVTKKRVLGPITVTVLVAVAVGIAIASVPPAGE